MIGGFGPLFILKDKKAIQVTIPEWSAFKENPENMLVGDYLTDDGARVHTVFAGFPIGVRGNELLLFETTVTNGPLNGNKYKYGSWKEAESNHWALVRQLTGQNILNFQKSNK